MEKDLKQRKIIYGLIILLYLPILLLSTKNIGGAISLNGDIKAYFENIIRFREGVLAWDFDYALNLGTMGYGSGLFILLSIICLPLNLIFSGEQAILIIIRIISLIALIVSLNGIEKIIQLYTGKQQDYLGKLIIIVIAFLPATTLLVTHIHPEILQFCCFVWGTYFLIEILEKNENYKRKWLGVIVLYAAVIGFKVSGLTYMIVPVMLIITSKEKTLKQKLIIILGCAFSVGIIAVIFLIPRIIISPKETVIVFVSEFTYFSKILKEMVISEFDYYQVLNNKYEVIVKWATHGFSHGYFSPIVVITMLCSGIYFIIKEKQNKVKNRLIFALISLFLLNYFYYSLFINRVASYYIYLPVIGLIIAIIIGIEKYDIKFKRYIYILLLVCCIPSFIHSGKVLMGQVKVNVANQSKDIQYEGLKTFLKERDYSAYSIHIPLSIPLSATSKELGWIPDVFKLARRKNYVFPNKPILNELQYYWHLGDLFKNGYPNLSGIQMFVIDKIVETEYEKYYQMFQENEWTNIYEDNAVIILGSLPLSAFPQNDILLDCKEEIFFEKGDWRSIYERFNPNLNLKNYNEIIVQFNLLNEKSMDTELRVVFNSPGEILNQNTWHYIISKENIVKGKNTIKIPFNKFVIQNGYLNWAYVSSISLGGVINEDITIRDVYIEVK